MHAGGSKFGSLAPKSDKVVPIGNEVKLGESLGILTSRPSQISVFPGSVRKSVSKNKNN